MSCWLGCAGCPDCMDDTPRSKIKDAPLPPPPDFCDTCGASLVGQFKSFRKCDACYEKTTKENK